jgi:hypothetical protein
LKDSGIQKNNRSYLEEPSKLKMAGEEATSNLTFEFPIRDSEGEAPMKNQRKPCLFKPFLTFMGYQVKILIIFFSSSMYCVEALTTFFMLKN